MKQLTVRGVPDELARALEREKKRRGQSLNQTILELLSQALGVGNKHDNGLSELAGSWTAEELHEFDKNTTVFEQIDPELWQ